MLSRVGTSSIRQGTSSAAMKRANVSPRRTSASFPVTHSIFSSNLAGQPRETGMRWNPDVLASVDAFLTGAVTT